MQPVMHLTTPPSPMQANRYRWVMELVGALVVATVLMLLVSQSGLSKSYDWDLYLPWLDEFARQLAAGEAFPQWMPSAFQGRGAPVFAYYPPLSFYLGSAFVIATGDPILGMKSVAVVAGLLCYVSFLAWARDVATPYAVAWAVVWALSPAMLFIGLRVHMLAAFCALPAIPILAKAILSERVSGRSRMLLVAFATAWLGWCHLPTLLMAGAAASIWVVMAATTKQGGRGRNGWLLGGAGLGLLMSASTLVGPLFESRELHLPALTAGALRWSGNFILGPPPSAEGFRVDYRFLSLIAVLFGLIGMWAATALWRSRVRPLPLLACFLTVGILMTPLAEPFYQAAIPFQYIQFPWRWLPLFVFVCCALAAAAPLSVQKPALVLSAAVVSFGVGMMTVGHSQLLPQLPRTTPDEESWVLREAPRSAPEYRQSRFAHTAPPAVRPRQLLGASTRFTATTTQDEAATMGWHVSSNESADVRTEISCFAGWQLLVSGKLHLVQCAPNGVVSFHIERGESDVELRMSRTPARWVAALLGVTSLLVVLAVVLTRCAGVRRIWGRRHR